MGKRISYFRIFGCLFLEFLHFGASHAESTKLEPEVTTEAPDSITWQIETSTDSTTTDSCIVCMQNDLLDVTSRFNQLEINYVEDRKQMFDYFDVLSIALNRLKKLEKENEALKHSVQGLLNSKQEMTQRNEILTQKMENLTKEFENVGLENDSKFSNMWNDVQDSNEIMKDELKEFNGTLDNDRKITADHIKNVANDIDRIIETSSGMFNDSVQRINSDISKMNVTVERNFELFSSMFNGMKTNLEEDIADIRNQHENDTDTVYTVLQDLQNKSADIEISLNNKLQQFYPTIENIVQRTLNTCRQEIWDSKTRVTEMETNVSTLVKNVQEVGQLINFTYQQTDVRNAEKRARDCKDLYDAGFNKDGVYKISPVGRKPLDAFCDMTNGGWTIIQRRENGSVSFDHNWNEYAEGFGGPEGDHWLGLRHLHGLTKNHPSQIHFRFHMTKTHAYATALYDYFYIEDEVAKFKMHVKPTALYNSEMKKNVDINYNFFYYHNGMRFSTQKNDYDNSSGNCAQTHGGGFWFNNCLTANINPNFSEMFIWNVKTFDQQVSKSVMKIRKMN